MTRPGRRRWPMVALFAALMATLAGCGSSSEGAGDVSATNAKTAESAATETTAKIFTSCSDTVILGNIFDEEMVADCMQISGVASKPCPDGSMVGLIDISGTPMVVHAGSSAERVDDTVAKKLNDAPPVRYDVDEAKLLDRCE